MNSLCPQTDLVIFSHHRWEATFQSTHHLATRYAQFRRVFYIEEPVMGKTDMARLHIMDIQNNLQVFVPYLPAGVPTEKQHETLIEMMNEVFDHEAVTEFSVLYDSPELLPMIETLPAKVVLLSRPEQRPGIPHPRLMHFGPLDKNLNWALIERMAQLRPEFQFIFTGPTAHLEITSLPQRQNIHYSGIETMAFLSSASEWDCVFMPYCLTTQESVINQRQLESFLSLGIPVISTALKVMRESSDQSNLIYIADGPEHFIEKVEEAMLTHGSHYQEEAQWEDLFHDLVYHELDQIPAYPASSLSAFIVNASC